MTKSHSILLWSLWLAVHMALAETDWCDHKYCAGSQGVHIRCNNNGEFGSNCTGEYHLENIQDLRGLILRAHNQYRNLLASGDLAEFEPAARMPAILRWDEDLALNAELNVKTCTFAHDTCRATIKYGYAGQNIYTEIAPVQKINVAQEIITAIYMWFDEYRDANRTVMEKYQKTIPQTGHFTLLMNDRINALGCAFLVNRLPVKPAKQRLIFTCDYTSTNIRNYPSYQAGKAGSLCERRNRNYNNLCNDKIDPNDFNWYKK